MLVLAVGFFSHSAEQAKILTAVLWGMTKTFPLSFDNEMSHHGSTCNYGLNDGQDLERRFIFFIRLIWSTKSCFPFQILILISFNYCTHNICAYKDDRQHQQGRKGFQVFLIFECIGQREDVSMLYKVNLIMPAVIWL